MRKIILGLALVLSTSMVSAQVEVKLNPFGLLFGSPDLSGEYFVTPNFGAELTLSAEMGKYTTLSGDDFDPKKSGFGVMASGKYYFSPKEDKSCSGFYAGVYIRQKDFKVTDDSNSGFVAFKRSIVGTGFLLGQKWVSKNGMMYELVGGLGRTLSEKNEWIDEEGVADDADLELGLDGILRFSIGYRF